MASFTRSELKEILEGQVLQDGTGSHFRNVSIDSRNIKKGSIFVAIQGADQDGHDFIDQAIKRGAQAVVLSKKKSVRSKKIFVVRVKDTTTALGKLAQAHRLRFRIPVIAITGSVGKTTTKELIASVLKAKYHVLKSKSSFNNQWGVPLTLLDLSSRYDVAVVEIGTNRPGEITCLSDIARPTIVVLTNVGASHLEEMKTIQNVFKEKRLIIKGLMPNGSVVFNADDPFLRSLKKLKRKKYSYGVTHKADIFAGDIFLDERGRIFFKINGQYKTCLKTPVRENVWNALASVVCARLLRISYKEICEILAKVKFDKNRQQIQRIKGVTVINDSYNANPISFRSALNTLRSFPSKGRRILVCGDMLELGSKAADFHRKIGEEISSFGVDAVLTVGSLMKNLAKGVKSRSREIPVFTYDNTQRLNRDLMKYISRGDVVLVKGSRGMRMERVVEFLEKALG